MSDNNTGKQYIAAIIATRASFATGLSFGWPSPVETEIVLDQYGHCRHSFCVSMSDFARIAACISVGSLTSAFFAGKLMSKIGRKRALVGYFVIIILGWLSVTFAESTKMLYFGRLLIGFGYGGSDVIVPVYVGEIAQPSIRGKLLSFVQANITSGTMVSYILGYFFTVYMQSLISSLLLVAFCATIFFIPESPSYYVYHGEIEKARLSLKWLRGPHHDTDAEIVDIIESSRTKENQGFKTFYKEKTNPRALRIVLGLFIGLETSGTNGVLFYASSIFQEARIGIEPDLAAVYVGLCAFLGTSLSIFLVDRFGRRVLLLISYATLFSCFTVMGTYFRLQSNDPETMENWRIIPVAVICLYIFMNAFGAASVVFVMMGEIFAQNVKDVAAGLSMTCDYTFSIIVALLFPFLVESIGSSGAFFIFSAFNAVTFFFVLFAVPETKGKSLGEIQQLLQPRRR